jgi:Zn-dependent protease
MTAVDIAYPIVWVTFFIISATFHEAAHAWAAKRGGDLTAYEGGQVSLNPVPHIMREPWGMIVFPVISSVIFGWPFGYAKTPYSALWADRHPRKAALMSAAGPLANLLIVVLCVAVIKVGMLTGTFLEPDSVGFKHIVDINSGPPGIPTVISMLFTLNLVLFVLNLLPLPPLDGSGIIAIFLNQETARKYQSVISNPAFGFLGFLLAWQVFNPVFHPIFLGVINLIFWPTRYG